MSAHNDQKVPMSVPGDGAAQPAAPRSASKLGNHGPGASGPSANRPGANRPGASRPGAPKPSVTPVASGQQDLGSVRKSVVFLGAVAVAYVLFLVATGQVQTFFHALAQVRGSWVGVGLLCYVAYYLLGVCAYAIAVVGDPTSPLGIADLMSVEATGVFFSNLTPNGTGGAPAQILRLTRSGLSVGAAGALQYTRFIIYEAAEGVFAALMLVPRLGYFIDTYGNVFLVGALLFGAKVVEVTCLLLVCLLPRQVNALGNLALGLVHGWGWIKDDTHERLGRVVNEQIYEFSNGFKTGARNVRLMALTLVVTLVQLGFQYALPWVVLRAFGIRQSLLTCLACGSILELLTSAIPLPGGTGGAEGGFAFLFGAMFGPAISAGYVVWRAIEYVLPVLAAVPLMGLRTRNGLSLNARLRRWRSSRRR